MENLFNHLKAAKCYEHNCSSINHIPSVLNSFFKNIKFTFEEEKDDKILVQDVLLLRNSCSIETTVYHKLTHDHVCLP